MIRGHPDWCAAGARWALLAAACLVAGPVLGQPATSPSSIRAWGARLAADEDSLWLVQVLPDMSRIYHRRVTGPFESLEPLAAPIDSMAASDDGLYAFVEEGALYCLGADGWRRQVDLPDRTQPLDLLGDDNGVYALIPSPSPGRLPQLVGGTRPPASQPFDAGGAPLTVARYDSRGWVAIAACPTAVTGDGAPPPRLGLIYGELSLVWHVAGQPGLAWVRLHPKTGRWRDAGTIAVTGTLRSFWILSVSRVPTLVLATRTDAASEELSALRLLGGLEGEVVEWRPAELRLSDLPSGRSVGSYEAAYGFNQHVALLMLDQLGSPGLRFGRIDAEPTEPTVSAADVFEGRQSAGKGPRWIQSATLLALFIVLVALFVLRRNAMVITLGLPAGYAPALTMQRVAGWVIDFAPCAIVAAALLHVDWRAGLRELATWATVGNPAEKLPAARTMLWWGIACGTSTLYALVMELLVQRTVGKLLMGTRVLSERGTAPHVLQTILRNVLRLLELMPPFWLLGFLVVLSRNRQRLGDIFARTLVVRHVKSAGDATSTKPPPE